MFKRWFTRKNEDSPPPKGQQAEQQAEAFLHDKGLRSRERNYSCSMGEIDLIMEDEDCLVFVEVRYRKQNRHGSALESVDTRKQRKVIRTAQHYLQRHKLTEKTPCRFDIVALNGETISEKLASPPEPDKIQWLKDAFSAY